MNAAGSESARNDNRRRRLSLGRLIDDFVILASGQLVSKVFGFLAFAWLARNLSIEDYGAVETAVGMAAIGSIALEMGTGAVGVRRISQESASTTNVLGAVITGRFSLALIIAPLLAMFYIVTAKSAAPDTLFWIFALSLFVIPLNHNWYFQAHERMGVAGFGQTLKMAVFFVAVLALKPQSNGVVYVAVAELIAATAIAAWFSIFAYYMIAPAHPKYSFGAGMRLLQESAQLGASSFVNALAQYLPILVVAAAASDAETAQFGAAQRLVISLMTFSYVYYFNLFPLIARRMIDDPDSLRQIMNASVRVTAWVGVAVAAVLSALAPAIMGLIFGREFAAAGQEFSVLLWSSAIILASGNARWLLVASKRQRSLLAAQIINAAIVVGLGYAFSIIGGGVGAAYGCAVGACGLWFVAHWRTKGLEVRPDLATNILPVITAGAIIGSLTIADFSEVQSAAVTALLLAAGMLADRRLLQAVRVLVNAKSAT